MGRRGGGGAKSSRGSGSSSLFGARKAAPPPARKKAPPPASKQAQQAPPPAQQPSGGGGMLSGLASTVMQGMAFGTGSAVAHRAVDAVAGPRQVEHVHSGQEEAAPMAPAAANPTAGPCGNEFDQFNQCVKDSQGDMASCRFYYDVLSQCQQNSNSNSKWS